MPDVLVKLIDLQLLGKLLEQEQEDHVVSKDDDLPGVRFLYQPARHALAPLVVEGRDGVVENDA